MTSRAKLLVKILSGTSDQNLSFDELVALLQYLGFQLRTAGSHHIFSREGVAEILNLQRPARWNRQAISSEASTTTAHALPIGR